MDKLDQAIVALKAEGKRLEEELTQVRSAIAALQGINNNGRRMTAGHARRTISAAARKRIVAAQRSRWSKWRAAQRKKGA